MFNQIKESFRVLGKENKNKVFKIFLIITFAVFFDILSIGLILPILTLFFDDEKFENYEILQNIKHYFNIDANLIIISLSLFFLLILIKVILLLYFEYKSQSYYRDFIINIMMKAYSYFLNLPWYKVINYDHSYIMRVIYNDANIFISNGIMQYLNLFKNFLFLSLIIIYLFFVNFKITLFVTVIFILITLILVISLKDKFYLFSHNKALTEKFRFKNLSESILSLRDIKLNGDPNYFLNLYKDNEEIQKKIHVNFSVLTKIPRNLFEVITIFLLILVMIYIQPDKSSLNELIPIFGLYGVVIIRLIPLFTQINQNVQMIRLSNNQINEIIKNINQQNKDKIEKNDLAKNSSNYAEEIKNINRIETKNLSFSYDGTNYIFKNLNLEFTANKTFYLEGKNGSGKSTLVDLISGMLKPTQGKIEINGVDISSSKFSMKSKVGYVSQTAFLINESIKENIIFGRKNIENKQLENVIKLTELDKLINNLPDKIETNVGDLGGKLSGGQKQKIMIARSLINNPGLIILDESTNALDFESEKKFLNIIDKIKKNKIIIFIAHSEQIKEFCDEKYLLQDKTIKKLFLK